MSNYVIIVISLIVTVILFVAAFWLFTHISNRRYTKYIRSNVNTIRSLTIDYNKQEIKFFNRNNLRNVKTVNINEYCKQFNKEDVNRFLSWLNELTKKNSSVNDYLEIDLRFNHTRHYYHSIYQVTYVDKTQKIINLDNYLFLHLSSKNKVAVESLEENAKIPISKLEITSKGYTVNFKFTYSSQLGNDEPMPRLLFTQLKEIAASTFSPPNKQLINVSSDEFIIIDFKSNNRNDDALDYIHYVNNEMRKFLEINGKLANVNISAGLVYNSYFSNSPKRLIDKARAMSEIAFSKSALIITYSKNMKNNVEEDKFDSEIEQVIKKNQIAYRFESIYSVKKSHPIGYISMPLPINTSAKTMDELYKRSLKTGENKALFQAVMKNSLAAFKSNSVGSDKKLFHHLTFNEAVNFLTTFRGNTSKDNNQAVIFDEYDIYYSSSKNKNFSNIIQKFKDKKISLALSLSDQSLILDNKIYLLFDYFFVYSSTIHPKKDDSIHLGLRTIIERLLKYKKPIILTHIDNWSTIEMFIRSGVEYVASSTIAPISEKIVEPTPKIVARIKRMIN